MIKSFSDPISDKKKSGKRQVVFAVKRLLFFLFAVAVGGSLCFAINDGQLRFENFLYAQISAPIDEMVYAVPKKPQSCELKLDAKAALSLRIDTAGKERMIFKKNTADILPIASLTKLMTAVIVVENPEVYNFEKQIVISRDAAGQSDVPVAGNLTAGEIYTVRQLLGLMLFYSSNDAAYALAEISGVDEFIVAMNKEARNIGLEDTGFYNPSGLDIESGETNYSTVDDLLLLVKYIADYRPEIFSMTVNSGNYVTENGIFSFKLWDKQKLTGGKTGYTEKAGGCMIALFENETGWHYVNILLGSASPESRVAEMQKLINCVNNSDQPIK
jgi:D-alanyl-D-alanine carboxypeptidase